MSQVWCSRLQCESISCVNLLSNLLWKLQLPEVKAGLEIRRMSLCHEHLQVCIFPLPLTVKQQVSSCTQASRIFIPSPSFLNHQPESSLLLLDVPTATDDACNKMEKDWGKAWDLCNPRHRLGKGWEKFHPAVRKKKGLESCFTIRILKGFHSY